MTLDEWISIGQAEGFCDEVICAQHNGLMTEEEHELFEQGYDPCVHVVRLLTHRGVAS